MSVDFQYVDVCVIHDDNDDDDDDKGGATSGLDGTCFNQEPWGLNGIRVIGMDGSNFIYNGIKEMLLWFTWNVQGI